MEHLISEETKVTVQAIQDISGLGFLDKSKGTNIPSLTELTQTQHNIESQILTSNSQNDLSLNDSSIPEGRKFQIPLWLAITLQNYGYVRIIVNEEFNKEYSRQFIKKATDVFEVNPSSINFSKFPFYFEVGGNIAQEIGDVELAKSIRNMMLIRLRRIYDEACNSSEQTNKFVRTLTHSEKELYQEIIDVNAQSKKVKTMELDHVQMSSFHDIIHK
ncbi:hypothetical protein EHI8A_056310 [Entamoeba histolytica HM-1:IMSS-B]|uniref:GINS subunit domain-containing protein n=4 Tax=Entamoeba histolytica TaxID=5759 RepID=C4MA61_ENTH1|nr:hypothetical protein EHI_069960 [Entamoeba histolytica HM-1:IMSS]EAL43399.1 hypothetical protein EHI_069960 [Entamoeba histolytica HM-1:IMSS]EMH73848.1 hypothetical protein EHI8A_056310 [Entamoeba histolytica HM-1:IMSS-B]ENY62843.1 hypothetical protein EHI7A_044660 [Entamoeba histolytica HM-1:IMSS-A]GAT98648.1 hypothetical protein CL6EHI_069960 [Entamoeba histolytica]|eukprot:XP_648782.1 hypothetical protein EHI_069960 [Entamoeba histolytica HM-1:IMSS]